LNESTLSSFTKQIQLNFWVYQEENAQFIALTLTTSYYLIIFTKISSNKFSETVFKPHTLNSSNKNTYFLCKGSAFMWE